MGAWSSFLKEVLENIQKLRPWLMCIAYGAGNSPIAEKVNTYRINVLLLPEPYVLSNTNTRTTAPQH